MLRKPYMHICVGYSDAFAVNQVILTWSPAVMNDSQAHVRAHTSKYLAKYRRLGGVGAILM